MGEHIDNRKSKRKKLKEGVDPLSRARRVTFKNYLLEVEEDLLEDDLENAEVKESENLDK